MNGALIATDTDGPPYVAEWQDENPFVPCTLAVEADVAPGTPIRDTVESAAAHDCGRERGHEHRRRRGSAGHSRPLCRGA